MLKNEIRPNKIHTAELLIIELSCVEFEIAVEKLKRYKSRGAGLIRAELIRAGGRIVHSEIHKLINSTWKEE
jgi:hypothetical protein